MDNVDLDPQQMVVQMDVSRRALYIARMIDRLPPGVYTIHLERPTSRTERWIVEVKQSVTVVQKKEIHETQEKAP